MTLLILAAILFILVVFFPLEIFAVIVLVFGAIIFSVLFVVGLIIGTIDTIVRSFHR